MNEREYNHVARLPRSFVFLLINDFSMMPFTSAIEPLRVANRMHGSDLYRWSTASADGKPVRASNGALLHVDARLDACNPGDAIIICTGINVADQLNKSVSAQLRRFARQGLLIGSVCTGSVLLAHAGLLDGHRCTVHWEEIDTLAENFPELRVTRSLFEIDRDRFTCSGGTAPLDLMLHFIAEDFGRDLGTRVADQMVHHSARKASEPQRLALAERTGARHPGLLEAIAAMESNLENPLTMSDIAARGGLSVRQMERHFANELGVSPTRYYRDLRLARARQMVQQTGMSMMQIAVATGFSSATHFAKTYGLLYGVAPRKDRELARRAQPPNRSAAALAMGSNPQRSAALISAFIREA